MTPDTPLTVREITAHIKLLLEHSELLRDVEVRGEISNFTAHSSGHLYFSLKDEHATLSCVCFRSSAARLGFVPEAGQRVIAGGEITVYEKGGRYQLLVRRLRPDGLGALAEALEKLKAKLSEEGLFDPSRKRPLPRFPSAIGLLTSTTGAAIRDMVTVISRRYPLAKLVIFPTTVQGEEAPESIVASLRRANATPGLDVLLLGRGGGSIEDLWAFNDERVARAIFASRVPVVSAVGHETDTTIADLVADVRAPTPSAAAEIVAPDRQELIAGLRGLHQRLALALKRRAETAQHRLAAVGSRPALRQPERLTAEYAFRVDEALQHITAEMQLHTQRCAARMDAVTGKLSALGPPAVLARGYSICRHAEDHSLITSTTQVRPGEAVEITVTDGPFLAETK